MLTHAALACTLEGIFVRHLAMPRFASILTAARSPHPPLTTTQPKVDEDERYARQLQEEEDRRLAMAEQESFSSPRSTAHGSALTQRGHAWAPAVRSPSPCSRCARVSTAALPSAPFLPSRVARRSGGDHHACSVRGERCRLRSLSAQVG